MTQDVAILDIGSDFVTVLTGRRGVNNTIIISGRGKCKYSGYCEGEWLEVDKLGECIAKAISEAEASANIKIDEIFVGVPGDFTTVVCKELNLSLSRKRRVSADDITLLYEQGNDFAKDPNYTLIHSQPIYFTLDDDRRLIAPEGMQSTKLGGCVSYILAEKKFLDSINIILASLGIERADYVSMLLAESLFLFEDLQRDQYVVFFDVGYIATDVVVARGDGILSQYSFPLGGGHISGDLATELNISFSEAESLRSKVLLSLQPSNSDVYQILGQKNTVSFSAEDVNNIVIESIAKIACQIAKCLNLCKYDYPDNVTYYLTGSGLANIVGAKDILAEMLGTQIEIAQPRLPHFAKPELSSMLGILDLVVSNEEHKKPEGFFKKLISFFTR